MMFQGRSVVITGAAKGIGAGCARVFCEAGGSVAILDTDAEAGEELARALTSAGPGTAYFQQCDVTDFSSLKSAIDAAADRFQRLDCLVNNAGSHPPALSIDDTSIELMDRLMRLNYTATFAGCRFAVPHLRATRGSLVIVSSMVALLGQNQSSAYCATKAAQIGLMRALAVELGPAGVRCNAICPSNVDTPLMRDWAATLPDPRSALDRVAAVQVLGRMATIEEIGRVALFLASDSASFITGQAIQAEGGASLDY